MIRTYLCTFLFWTYVVFMLPVLFVPALGIYLATFLFDPRGRILHYYTSFWCGHHLFINPMWRLSIEGRENLDSKKACILCCNHQSTADIPVLFNLYYPFKFVSKHSNFFIPFIGWNMHLNRYVRLVRGDVKSVVHMFETCEAWLNKGVSILMFPEGTRSKDGSLLPFKPGAFRLAHKAKVPIVPIVVDRTMEALPRDGVLRQSGIVRVRMVVGEPIDSLSFSDPESLLFATREKMRAMQKRIWSDRGYEGPPEESARVEPVSLRRLLTPDA